MDGSLKIEKGESSEQVGWNNVNTLLRASGLPDGKLLSRL